MNRRNGKFKVTITAVFATANLAALAPDAAMAATTHVLARDPADPL